MSLWGTERFEDATGKIADNAVKLKSARDTGFRVWELHLKLQLHSEAGQRTFPQFLHRITIH